MLASVNEGSRRFALSVVDMKLGLTLPPTVVCLFLAAIGIAGLACEGRESAPPSADRRSPARRPFVVSADEWHARALAHRQRGDDTQAEAACREALREDPRHRQTVGLLADLHISKGRYGKGAAVLEQALSAGLDDTELHHDLGKVYTVMDRLEEARLAFAVAVELDSANVRALNNLAAIYARTSNVGRAIEVLEKVHQLDPDYVVGLHSLGLSYAENGEYDKAADLLNRVVELAPDHVGARYQLGLLHHNQARYEAAAASLEAALSIDSTSAAVHFELGKTYHELGRRQQALRHLTRATELDSTSVDAFYRLGQIWARLGEEDLADAAFAAFRRWRQRARENPRLWRQIRYHKQALTVDPGSERAHYALARMFSKQGWSGAAIQQYRWTVQTNPRFLEAWRRLGKLCLEERRPEEAATAFEQIVRRSPSDLSSWNHLGVAYTAAGRLGDALATFEQALGLAPRSVSLHFNMGNTQHKRGQLGKALASYRQAMQLDPENSRIRESVERLEREVADAK